MVAIGLLNPTAITLNLAGGVIRLSETVVIVSMYLLGIAVALGSAVLRGQAGLASSQRLAQWSSQDEKLRQEIQSDREKQLEAKIATLEAALQKVLKK